MDAPNDELAKVRAERAARERARAKRHAEEDAAKLFELEKLASSIEAAVDEAEKEHGRLGQRLRKVDVRYPDGTLIGAVLVKAPAQPAWLAFENTFGDAKGTKKDELQSKLLQGCLVWPVIDIVERYIRDQPGLRSRLSLAIRELAVGQEEEAEGK